MATGSLAKEIITIFCCVIILVLGAKAAPNMRGARGSWCSRSTAVEDPELMKKIECWNTTGSLKKTWGFLGSYKWNHKNVLYNIANNSNKLSDKNAVAEKIREAFAIWEKHTDLRFTPASIEEADIVITFEHEVYADNIRFYGDPAHGYCPEKGGQIYFNEDVAWNLTKFYHIAVHEIGHALGLGHTDDPISVMRPIYPDNVFPDLGPLDIKRIQKLYGKNSVEDLDFCTNLKIDTVFESDGHVYAFRGKYYWEIKDGYAYGKPKLIVSKWKELPGDIDAAYTHHKQTFFFKGSMVWTYSGDQMIYEPKKIGKKFHGIPNDIDAATVWSGDGNVYFFKGSKYWRCPQRHNSRASRPRNISDWLGLPKELDAAVSVNGNTYFFKGENMYEFDDHAFSVNSKGVQKMSPDFFGYRGCERSN